jgi:hypothetical protein
MYKNILFVLGTCRPNAGSDLCVSRPENKGRKDFWLCHLSSYYREFLDNTFEDYLILLSIVRTFLH